MTESMLPPLARSAMDRDYLSRANPELFDLLWEEKTTRVLPMRDGRVLLEGGNGPRLKLLEIDRVPTAKLRVYLGRTNNQEGDLPAGSAVVLATLSENAANELEPNAANWKTLREIGGGLSDRDAGIFTQALSINNWHISHQHCPSCGTPTVIEMGGWVRRCLKEGTEIFPRTDPAVIVAITDEQDRILLGSQGVWEENRWSILAGFVEPGESLEAAVVREMFEESGLLVSKVEYVYSQSWPYPRSLMLGFSAFAKSTAELRPDGEEIAKLKWFSREELLASAKDLLLPNRSTISRALIERWLGQSVESARELNGDGQQ